MIRETEKRLLPGAACAVLFVHGILGSPAQFAPLPAARAAGLVLLQSASAGAWRWCAGFLCGLHGGLAGAGPAGICRAARAA